MCRSKTAVNATQPTSTSGRNSRTSRAATKHSLLSPPKIPKSKPSPLKFNDPSSSSNFGYSSSGSTYRLDSSTATTSVLSTYSSLSSLRDSLPENAHIYDFSEIRSATNNFLAKRFSSSSSHSWRCSLRNKDVIIFQHKTRRPIESSGLKDKLSILCRSHHGSIIKLLGAAISGDHIYLVYEYIFGASLSDCLRNTRNPNFTVLSNWMSRIQIATDLAHGLDYIHNNTGQNLNLVHKYVKSSSVIVVEPSFNAKICHFGTALLCGETRIEAKAVKRENSGEITEVLSDSPPVELKKRENRELPFEGVRGYMSPEFQLTGLATQESDVYAFGVVILEILSGEEPVKYKFDRSTGEYRKISLIEVANEAVEGDDEQGDGRLRRWVDKRMKDSFPVNVVKKLTRLALECVQVDPGKRPNMARVAGKISKLYLESRIWSERMKVPTEISVSFAPR